MAHEIPRVTVSGLTLDPRYTCGIFDEEGPGIDNTFELQFIGWTTETRTWQKSPNKVIETEIVPVFLAEETDACTVRDLNKFVPDNYTIVFAGFANHKDDKDDVCQVDKDSNKIVKS